MKLIISISILFFSNLAFTQVTKVDCLLTDIATVEYSEGKILKKAYHEKAKARPKFGMFKFRSIIKDLHLKKPKMVSPDNIELIKLKENDGVYWLTNLDATSAVVSWTIDTKNKIIIQDRSVGLPSDSTYSQSWIGKCK